MKTLFLKPLKKESAEAKKKSGKQLKKVKNTLKKMAGKLSRLYLMNYLELQE